MCTLTPAQVGHTRKTPSDRFAVCETSREMISASDKDRDKSEARSARATSLRTAESVILRGGLSLVGGSVEVFVVASS